jgi:hypothetical protein
LQGKSKGSRFLGAFFCPPERTKKPGFSGLRYRSGLAFGVAASHPSNPLRGPGGFQDIEQAIGNKAFGGDLQSMIKGVKTTGAQRNTMKSCE